MTRRARNGLIVLAVIDALAWALTIHAHLTFRRSANGPSVMPVSQLLGWVISVAVLLLLIFCSVSMFRTSRRT